MASDMQPEQLVNQFGAIWGPSLIATFLASGIYGIAVLQTFYYYKHYRWDRMAWKALVMIVFVLDTVAMALWMYCIYYYLVTSWGRPEMTAIDVREFPSEYVVTAFLTFVVQGFYISTISALKAPILVTLLLLTLSVVALSTGLVLPVVQLRLHFIQTIVASELNHIAFNIARSAALACDLGVVIALCWLLRKRKTGIPKTHNIINALMMFAVQRGVLQAVVQAGEVIAYAIKPHSVYFLPFHVIVSKIYCTSLLASLNSRDYVARKGALTDRKHTCSCPRHSAPASASLQLGVKSQRRPQTSVSAPVLSTFMDPVYHYSSSPTSWRGNVESSDATRSTGTHEIDMMDFAIAASEAELGIPGDSMRSHISTSTD